MLKKRMIELKNQVVKLKVQIDMDDYSTYLVGKSPHANKGKKNGNGTEEE
jgi:DNA repair exonuclease SbcCD ATPase subunit